MVSEILTKITPGYKSIAISFVLKCNSVFMPIATTRIIDGTGLMNGYEKDPVQFIEDTSKWLSLSVIERKEWAESNFQSVIE